MQSYLELLNDVLINGESHDDRTGVGTVSVFGRQWRHDMRDGFPLLTTKKMPLRVIFEELKWFLSGSTNRNVLQSKNVKIWDEWNAPNPAFDGDMGPIYGRQFRSFGKYEDRLVPVEIKTPSNHSLNYSPPFMITDDLKFEIIKKNVDKNSQSQTYDRVRCGSGYEYNVRRDQIQRNSVRDPYQRSRCGVGYLGEPVSESEDKKILYNVWSHMLERCYDNNCKEYKSYGAAGVTVCIAWHDFSVFYRQAKMLNGWCHKLENPSSFELDKDHFGANCYSFETCLWLPGWMNKKYRFKNPFLATSPTGEIYYHISTQSFANEHGLSANSITRCLRGERPNHRGWTFATTEDRGFGFSIPVDQIATLLDQIKDNPNSRRLMVTAWCPPDIPFMALPPCHYGFQIKCHEETNEMSLHMTMRSTDALLGLPFNIASYGLLLKMLAAVTGRTARELIISFGDLHIYKNHREPVLLQLTRTPRMLPSVGVFIANPTWAPLEQLLGIEWKDIKMIGYIPHPKIEADVAV